MGLIAEIHKDLEKGALQLIVEYRDRLKLEAVKLCGDNASAEDLVFRTFERVLAKVDTYKDDINLFAWMKTIMENIHRDDLKRPVNRGTEAVAGDELERYAGADWSTDEQILRDSDSEAIREAIAGLDPKYHQVLLMRYYDEFSMKQIAGILRLPLGTVTRRVQIAHRLLAGKLGVILGRGKKPLAVILVALVSLVSAAAVATLPVFEPLRATVAGWFGGDGAQPADVFSPEDVDLGRVGVPPPTDLESPTNGVPPPTETGSSIAISYEPQLQETQPQEEKQTMKLAQTFAAAALAVTTVVGTVEAAGVTLAVDKAQQRYPWNGLVDIDYTITLDEGVTLGPDENLEVLMIDKSVDPAVTNRAISFLQAPLPLTAGKHRITWDANADGVTNYFSKASFVVKIAHYAPAYMVIDVSGGPNTNLYPVTFLNGEPAGGFNVPAYKGNKIVLRRIHPGSYMAGSPSSPAEAGRSNDREVQHRVAISAPFYIGLFEITQQQYFNVMGTNPSQLQGDDWQYRPVANVTYYALRGTANASTYQYYWPMTNAVDDTLFMGKLRTKCKLRDENGEYTKSVEGFDLPTEFQWEYACRAGTTGAFNTTNEYANTDAGQKSALALLGRYSGNKTDVHGNATGHTIVGSYLPNQWGLYDMHGNVWEMCLDFYQADVVVLGQSVDPKGSDTGKDRVMRGGSCDNAVDFCRSAHRNYSSPAATASSFGFRLCRRVH